MILHIPENGSHLNKNNISSDWQKGSISEAGLEPSIWPQRMADLDPQFRSICHLGIQ